MEISGANDLLSIEGAPKSGVDRRSTSTNTKSITQYQAHTPQNSDPLSNDHNLRPEVKPQSAGYDKPAFTSLSAEKQTELSASTTYLKNSSTLDKTAIIARDAIAAYRDTQHIEERDRFTEVLGIDEFA